LFSVSFFYIDYKLHETPCYIDSCNIVDGSIVMAPSQDKVLPPSSSSPDRDALRQTWIVRQNCKDSAIDVVKAFPLPETIDEAKKKILELAEEFEKWVFRQDGK